MEFNRYLTIFQDESREAMQQLNDQLLALERTPNDPELLHAIFRTTHTFKGMASTMGFEHLADIAHGMESLLDGLRQGALLLERPLTDLLLEGVEALEQLLETLDEPSETAAHHALVGRFEEAMSRTRVIPAVATPVEKPVETPPIQEAVKADSAVGKQFRVQVTLEPMCLLKSVRAMMIVTSLEMLGEVLDITPSLEELEWSDDTRSFELMLRTEATAEVIESSFQCVSEVETVKVTELEAPVEATGTLSADAPALVLESAQREQLSGALAVGFQAFRIEVTMMPDSLMKSVRAAMVLEALKPFGEVVRLDPAMGALEAGITGDRFWVTTLSVAAPTALREALVNIGEVTAIAIQPLTAGDVAAAGTPSEPAAAVVPVADIQEAEAEPDTPAPIFQTAGAQRRHQTVRVSTEHLDALLSLVNELAADHARLVRLGEQHGLLDTPGLIDVVRHMGALTASVQGEVRNLRMVPVETVFNRFPRMIRNLARELGKEVSLVMNGQHTPLDRLVADELGDPLVHLLRNALDHGLETPEERLAAGKHPEGRLTLSASHEGGEVVITAADDGRGMDPVRILAKAVSKGLVSAAQAEQLTAEQAIDFIFAPGFSTAETVTSVSGRGVGLDVVRNKITALGGTLEVDTRLGTGTTFRVRLPLTMALVQAMLTDVGGEVYAIPMGYVEDVYPLSEEPAHETLPLVRLRDRLEVTHPELTGEPSVVVVRTATQRVGLVVEQLLGKHEIAIKPLSRLLGEVHYLTGAAPLDDGRVALILDPGHLV